MYSLSPLPANNHRQNGKLQQWLCHGQGKHLFARLSLPRVAGHGALVILRSKVVKLGRELLITRPARPTTHGKLGLSKQPACRRLPLCVNFKRAKNGLKFSIVNYSLWLATLGGHSALIIPGLNSSVSGGRSSSPCLPGPLTYGELGLLKPLVGRSLPTRAT
jgi:hypothetical protein